MVKGCKVVAFNTGANIELPRPFVRCNGKREAWLKPARPLIAAVKQMAYWFRKLRHGNKQEEIGVRKPRRFLYSSFPSFQLL